MSKLTKDELEELLKRGEGPTLDFKRRGYRLDNDHHKGQFIKDILSMANTPREEEAHILLGVEDHRDGSRVVTGLPHTDHHDDADLQALVRSKTNPVPLFAYEVMRRQGKDVGVIRIECEHSGPYLARWEPQNSNVLRKDKIYFRRGSQNDIANAEEIRRIAAWMSANSERPSPAPTGGTASSWGEFSLGVHQFDDEWLHVLALGKHHGQKESLTSLGTVNWAAVFDFDPGSRSDGTFAAAEPQLRLERSVPLLVLGDSLDVAPDVSTTWFMANGMSDAVTTLVSGGWRQWLQKYDTSLKRAFTELAKASDGRPLVLTILGLEPDYANSMAEAALLAFGDAMELVIGTQEPDEFQQTQRKFDAALVRIGVSEVCAGLRNSRKPRVETDEQVYVPATEGEAGIARNDLAWLEEDLEILHLSQGRDSKEESPEREFLRGAAITWRALALHADVDRDATPDLVDQLLRELASRRVARFNLFHWPGSGGTTIGRRVAWEIHRKYPVVVIRRIRGEQTFSRLRFLFDASKLPILALADGSDIRLDDLEILYTRCSATQLPVAFLTVNRTRSVRGQASERSTFVPKSLSRAEAGKFSEVYSKAEPSRRGILQRIVKGENDRHRNPFYFGLAAFERDFRGLESYVSARLNDATTAQKALLAQMSLVYHFSQRTLPAFIFADLLGCPRTSPVRMTQNLGEQLLDLLVSESRQHWRPAHELIATEVLEQLLAGEATDRRVWRQNLSLRAVEFAEMVANNSGVTPDELMETVRRVFTLRDSEELLGTSSAASSEYSPLLEEIPTPEGRLLVLQKLVELFPEEPHFWGHLGRFYSQSLHEYDKAIEALDHALDLDELDDVIHHMKGMMFRINQSQLMEASRQDMTLAEVPDLLEELKELAEKAAAEFRRSREIDGSKEHGYISHVQMIVRHVEYAAKASESESVGLFLSDPENIWYLEQVEEAEGLLEGVERIRIGTRPSRFYVGCRADLDGAYGDYAEAIAKWSSLLNRTDVYLPPVRRQIAYAYIQKSRSEASQLNADELHRVKALMEVNLGEDPADSTSIKLWFRVVRQIEGFPIERAIEKVSQWRSLSEALDASFYLYVLHTLKAIDGSDISRSIAHDLIRECKQKASGLRNRHYTLEWFGKSHGLKRLVDSRQLGSWDEEFADPKHLERVEGVVREIRPQSGTIEMASGLQVFFNPSRKSGELFIADRDLNRTISYYLGFSYDGLRAWDPASVPATEG